MPLAPYLGDPSLVNSNTAYVLPALPQNPETANATTVTDPLKICVDDIHYLAKQMSAYRPHVSIVVTGNYTTLSVNTVNSLSVFDGIKWFFISKPAEAVGVAALEGGGNFTPNQVYYLYLRATGAYVLSLDKPDETLCFKNSIFGPGSIQYRYMGSMIASGATTIYPFSMIDFDYTMTIPMGTNYSNVAFAPAFDTWTDLTCLFQPPTTIISKFICSLSSTSTIDTYWFFDIRPKGAPNVTNTWWNCAYVPALPLVELAGTRTQIPVLYQRDCPPGAGGIWQAANVNPVAFAVNTASTTRIYWNGYKE